MPGVPLGTGGARASHEEVRRAMELEELRNRLLLRSKSAEIPPVAEPISIPEIPAVHNPPERGNAVDGPAGAATAPPKLPLANADSDSISLLAKAVDQLFQPTQAFRAHFAHLTKKTAAGKMENS